MHPPPLDHTLLVAGRVYCGHGTREEPDQSANWWTPVGWHSIGPAPAGLIEMLSEQLGLEIGPEDLLAYCYAVLATPSYFERFSEELTIPGPRIPVTKDPALFAETVTAGRRPVWLHTDGERLLPAGVRRGQVPQGTARTVTAIPAAPDKYPEAFSYDAATETLAVGDGDFAPEPEAAGPSRCPGSRSCGRGWPTA